jgi:FkbM family methyltransferase
MVYVLAILGLLVALTILGAFIIAFRRLDTLRRRLRRTMFVGPEFHLRLQKQIYERLAAADCRARNFQPRLPLEFRSEWGEDVLLYDLFDGQATGTFIEAGALDGRRNSVTWVFEALGWRGLLVEPIPERAAECKQNRPGSTVIHAALGPEGGAATTSFMVPQSEEHQLSAYREHEGMSTEHVSALERAGASLKRIDVPLLSLNKALADAGFNRIDFASIDVEGGELEVLKGFDLARFRPRVLVVEELTLGDDNRAAAYILAAGGGSGGGGYKQVMWIGANRVFIRADDAALMARAERLAETVYSPFVRPRGGQSDNAAFDLR